MLPSLLAREIQNGLKHFLTTGFEPSDPLFAGVMQRFTDDEGRWLKGPYVQIGLPFRTGTRGRTFFGSFETEFTGHVHQEAAWQRLASQLGAAGTLVAVIAIRPCPSLPERPPTNRPTRSPLKIGVRAITCAKRRAWSVASAFIG